MKRKTGILLFGQLVAGDFSTHAIALGNKERQYKTNVSATSENGFSVIRRRNIPAFGGLQPGRDTHMGGKNDPP